MYTPACMSRMEEKEDRKVFEGLLAVATLFLGFLTFNLQQAQNDLLQREFLPQFVVESILSTSTPVVETIRVYHHGGSFSAFSATAFSEYEVTLPTTFQEAGRPKILPVGDYFFTDYSYTPYENYQQIQADGLIKVITSTTTAYERVLKLMQNYNKDTSPTEYKSLNFKSYLIIGYNDIFGKRHAEYYYIFPNFSYKIPIKKGEEISSRRYELYTSTVSSLDSLDRILQVASEQKVPGLFERIFNEFEQGKNYNDANEFYIRTTGCTIENLMECNPSPPG